MHSEIDAAILNLAKRMNEAEERLQIIEYLLCEEFMAGIVHPPELRMVAAELIQRPPAATPNAATFDQPHEASGGLADSWQGPDGWVTQFCAAQDGGV